MDAEDVGVSFERLQEAQQLFRGCRVWFSSKLDDDCDQLVEKRCPFHTMALVCARIASDFGISAPINSCNCVSDAVDSVIPISIPLMS